MEQVIRIVLIMIFAVSGASAMACAYPGEPDFSVPNGSSATKEEMIDAQGKVKSFVGKVESYLACLDQNLASASTDEASASAEQSAIYELRYNAAVESMELVADQFNNALRDYKDAQ